MKGSLEVFQALWWDLIPQPVELIISPGGWGTTHPCCLYIQG